MHRGRCLDRAHCYRRPAGEQHPPPAVNLSECRAVAHWLPRQRIPMQLFQSHRSFDALDGEQHNVAKCWQLLNPHLRYRFFNDSEALAYTRSHCGEGAAYAYEHLHAGLFTRRAAPWVPTHMNTHTFMRIHRRVSGRPFSILRDSHGRRPVGRYGPHRSTPSRRVAADDSVCRPGLHLDERTQVAR